MASISTAETMALNTRDGVRRPQRPNVRSDTTPPASRPRTAVIEETAVTRARLDTLLAASITSICAGIRIC